MLIASRVSEIRSASRAAKARGQKVGLVPTMGYLHEGHMALVRRAKQKADWVAVSIFVNPTQFGPSEDFARYPRDFDRDAGLCRTEGVDALFAPPVEEVYPPGNQTWVAVDDISKPLCGVFRPGHFRGVATVVCKLFHMVEPDVAVFGEKDYQQLQVVRQMARDLNMTVEIEGVAIVREPDGLALSSRNAYLSPEERRRALCLSAALRRAAELTSLGEHHPEAVLTAVRQILDEAGARVEYAEIRDPQTLEPLERIATRAVLALAVYIGKTRLIDNCVLSTG